MAWGEHRGWSEACERSEGRNQPSLSKRVSNHHSNQKRHGDLSRDRIKKKEQNVAVNHHTLHTRALPKRDATTRFLFPHPCHHRFLGGLIHRSESSQATHTKSPCFRLHQPTHVWTQTPPLTHSTSPEYAPRNWPHTREWRVSNTTCVSVFVGINVLSVLLGRLK